MNNHKQASLHTLIELTQNRADHAGAQLGRLTTERRSAAQQLAILEEYREDYANRLNNSSQSGMTASNYHNFTCFLATLDDAILQQNRVMSHMDHNIHASKEHWRSTQQRLLSYETLQKRRDQQRVAHENRREQLLSDELSATMCRRSSPDRGPQ